MQAAFLARESISSLRGEEKKAIKKHTRRLCVCGSRSEMSYVTPGPRPIGDGAEEEEKVKEVIVCVSRKNFARCHVIA